MTKISPHTILDYFKELLKFNKLPFLKDTAIEEIKIKYSEYVDSVDKEKGIIKYFKLFYNQSTNDSIEGLVTYDFYKEHKLELLEKIKDAISSIDELIYQKSEREESYNALLKNISKELHYLFIKADKVYPTYPELKRAIKSIESHLLLRYQIQPFSKVVINEKQSYFGVKDAVSEKLFQDLYDLSDRLELIEYDVVDERTFLDVFLRNPSDKSVVIQFSCNNGLAITFLESLRPFFTSLNPKTIEKSQRFLTKQGLVLTESNYNTSKKRLKDSEKLKSLKLELQQILDL
ncbi:DUF6617 family protein [Gelidibacter gilvus]|uniref:Uncharacterized protein n=1 Tax=Gelidibacter gilvus TaxID=59602 RepID=A0A4Q0XKR6_9FLAO|nr:DUF6617 family protein [Gelidibacter gilvus]RXJ52624.1 hypothetical protein ESZ48_02720 [Gelidibacter gilvus]